MDNNNDITCKPFTQSKIFKNILLAGMEMVAFLNKAEFDDSKQKESAKKIVKGWSKACSDFANDEEIKWQEICYNEIIEDIAEYLAKAKSMVEMALKAELDKISAATLQNYFEEISNLINTAETVFEDLQ